MKGESGGDYHLCRENARAASRNSDSGTKPLLSSNIPLANFFCRLNIVRFWGWEENAREQAMNRKEMDARIAAGLPAYGEPSMDEAAQAAAARNSKYAALKFCKYQQNQQLTFEFLGGPLSVYFFCFILQLILTHYVCVYSRLNVAGIPWFNTTNHKFHLADTTPNKSEN